MFHYSCNVFINLLAITLRTKGYVFILTRNVTKIANLKNLGILGEYYPQVTVFVFGKNFVVDCMYNAFYELQLFFEFFTVCGAGALIHNSS